MSVAPSGAANFNATSGPTVHAVGYYLSPLRGSATASVICRLEDSDYEGHSLSMLRRIAAVLGRQVKIVLVPVRSGRASA
jgi:hypothetical protein